MHLQRPLQQRCGFARPAARPLHFGQIAECDGYSRPIRRRSVVHQSQRAAKKILRLGILALAVIHRPEVVHSRGQAWIVLTKRARLFKRCQIQPRSFRIASHFQQTHRGMALLLPVLRLRAQPANDT